MTETRRVPVTREELQRSITVDQQAVLTAIWDHFQKENEWVPHVQLHRRFIGGGIGTAGVQAAVDALPEGIVWSNNWEGGIHRYALSFAGVLLADQGKEVEPLMVRHLEYVKCRYLAEEDGKIKSRDVAAALDLSPGEVHFLGRIVHLSTFRGTSSSLGSEEWDTDPPHDVDELAEAEDVRSFLWNRALWNVAWVEEIPVWEGVEWGDGFIAVFGPLDSLADRDAEEHDPRAVEALKEAGYEVRFARQDKVSQHRSQDYRFVYATDRRTWKRKLAQGKEQYLMARRREL